MTANRYNGAAILENSGINCINLLNLKIARLKLESLVKHNLQEQKIS